MKTLNILLLCFGILLLAGANTNGQNPPSRPNTKNTAEVGNISSGVQVKIIYTYDEAGNRISKTYTTEYVIDDPGLVTPVITDTTNTFNFEDPNLNFPINPTPSPAPTPTPTPKPNRPRP